MGDYADYIIVNQPEEKVFTMEEAQKTTTTTTTPWGNMFEDAHFKGTI